MPDLKRPTDMKERGRCISRVTTQTSLPKECCRFLGQTSGRVLVALGNVAVTSDKSGVAGLDHVDGRLFRAKLVASLLPSKRHSPFLSPSSTHRACIISTIVLSAGPGGRSASNLRLLGRTSIRSPGAVGR